MCFPAWIVKNPGIPHKTKQREWRLLAGNVPYNSFFLFITSQQWGPFSLVFLMCLMLREPNSVPSSGDLKWTVCKLHKPAETILQHETSSFHPKKGKAYNALWPQEWAQQNLQQTLCSNSRTHEQSYRVCKIRHWLTPDFLMGTAGAENKNEKWGWK